MKLIAFCEAPGDFCLLSSLVDRVLGETKLDWVVDNLDTPEVVRTWQGDGFGNDFIDIHALNKYTQQLRERGVCVRQIRGHFNGRPGDSGSAMARKAFLIAEALSRHAPEDPISAVVLVLDTDDEQRERPNGVKAARDEAQGWRIFEIVCGFPNPEREAWVLAGFDPCHQVEQHLLDELHRELGFSPVHHAVRLRDRSPGALRNIKRVLAVLTATTLTARHAAGSSRRSPRSTSAVPPRGYRPSWTISAAPSRNCSAPAPAPDYRSPAVCSDMPRWPSAVETRSRDANASSSWATASGWGRRPRP